MMENENDGRTADVQVLLRPAAMPCDGCRPEVVPVVVGVLPALIVTMAEDGFGNLSRVAIDATGPDSVSSLVDFLESLTDALKGGVISPVVELGD